MQQEHQCYFFIANYHALTTHPNPQDLRASVRQVLVEYLACGINPEQATVYLQSDIREIPELYMLLNMHAYLGELEKVASFKDKVRKQPNNVNAGLLTYPVLMTADVLIHKATKVPVGKDQEQHLELSRNIAQRFNHQFGKEYFVHPEPLFTETPKILSPADPNKKMSKSLGEKHYINLFGEEDRVRKQIKSAVTDTGDTAAGEMSAGVKNLFELLRACKAMDTHDALMADYLASALRYSDLKEGVANAVVGLVNPFREQLAALNADKRNVKMQIQESSAEIRKRAQQTLKEVRDITGLGSLK